jgi:hypothetical protein
LVRRPTTASVNVEIHIIKVKMKRISIYFKGAQVFIIGNSQTPFGLWIENEPCYKIGIDENIAYYISQCLLKTYENVKHPQDWKSFNKEYLKKVGYSSLKKFYTGSSLFIVCEGSGIFTIVPTKKDNNDVFTHLEDKKIVLHDINEVVKYISSPHSA